MIRIMTDSVASIPADMLEGTDIEVVSLFVNRDGVEYEDAHMDLDDFYADIYEMVDNIPTSSQPSQQVLEELFMDAAEAGDVVLGVFISSQLSGTYENALRAARMVQAHNINFKYAIIDSASCAFDEAWAVFSAVDAVREKKNLKQCVKEVLQTIQSSRFLFTTESLTFLQKGGRIGNAAALLGNLLQLSPILTVTDGEAGTVAKVRTHKKALNKMMTLFKDDVEKYGLKNVVVQYIGDRAPAAEWAKKVVEPYLGKIVRVLPVSPVIGLHVGPAIGICYECKWRLRNKVNFPVQSLVYTQ